jgi:chaperonin GroES
LLKNFKINHLALGGGECQNRAKGLGFINFFETKHLGFRLKSNPFCATYLALVRGECQWLGFPETGQKGARLSALTLVQTEEDTNMKFRPLHDRVLLRRLESDAKTAGGIIIPDTAKEKPAQGEVLAVGSGTRDEAGKLVPLDVKSGDLVLFSKWSGTEVTIEGEELLVVKESDIMGIIEGKSENKKAKKAA